MNNVVALSKKNQPRLCCSNCGIEVDAGCSCGVAYEPAARAAKAVKEHPERSDHLLAAEAGVNRRTINKARKQLVHSAPVGTRIGKDGRARKLPTKNPAGHAMIFREMKLGSETVQKIKGTSLDHADEMDELIFLNRGAPAGEHTDIVKALVADAAAGKAVSAIVARGVRKVPSRLQTTSNAVDPQQSAERRKAEAAAAEGVRAKPADGYVAMVDAWHAATADEQRGMLRFIGADFVEGPNPPTQNLMAAWKKRMAFVWQWASRAEQDQLVDFLKVRIRLAPEPATEPVTMVAH